MKIEFSRHSKRRAKLYKIPESIILNLLENISFTQGKHEVIRNVENFDFPIKMVITVKKNTITVITIYPLKKGVKK